MHKFSFNPVNRKKERTFNWFVNWINIRPEFDTEILVKQKCWPITQKHYKPFTIDKRNGSKRNLVTVNKNLKEIQSNLAIYFETNYSVSKYAHGFVAKKSKGIFPPLQNKQNELSPDKMRPKGVITNALSHTNKKVVISIDLKDFFPSITFPRVMGLLKSHPYNFSNKQSAILASLICLPKEIDANRGLPQGSPSSPIISNLICNKLDYQLGKLASKYDISYTRYADDITFSTNNLKRISANEIIFEVIKCVERNGFKINESKTKIMYKNQRQIVTGIIVNEGLNLQKKYIDSIRATLHNLENKYSSIDEAVVEFWKLKENLKPYDSYLPLGFYSGGYRGRYIKSPTKGHKSTKPTSPNEFNNTYAQHLLGRILWYGQVVTTGITTPYDLSKRKFISPKQQSRINKYEEMLASYYRIAIKFNWPVDHIILRLANKLPNLQSLVKMNPSLLLEPVVLTEDEQSLIDKASKLRNEKLQYEQFFNSAPKSLQRVLKVENRSHINFSIDTIRKFSEKGWEAPSNQQKLFNEMDTEDLSDLFHKSTNKQGHNVKKLLTDLVKTAKPNLRYLSNNVRKKVLAVHKELLELIRSEGDNIHIVLENESTKTKNAAQAIRDLKLAVRLYDNDADNFYKRVVLEAINNSETDSLVTIDKDSMAERMVTDINAWKDALTQVLISIKQHAEESEKNSDSTSKRPYSIRFKNENPVNGQPRALEIYRLNTNLPFKRKLGVDAENTKGNIIKWLTGRDLLLAVKHFIPVGDIFVHGNYLDCSDITVNLTEHTYQKSETIIDDKYGKLFISLQELKN